MSTTVVETDRNLTLRTSVILQLSSVERCRWGMAVGACVRDGLGCARHLSGMSQACVGHGLDRHLSGMCQACVGHGLDACRACVGHLLCMHYASVSICAAIGNICHMFYQKSGRIPKCGKL